MEQTFYSQSISQQTQTDYSFIFLQEKLQRKEFEILHLKNKLEAYKQKLSSLETPNSPALRSSPSFPQLPNSSELPFNSRLSTLSQQSTNKSAVNFSKILRNTPLDTLVIEEYSKKSPKNTSAKLRRENQQTESRVFLKPSATKKRLKHLPEDPSFLNHTKKASKSTKKLKHTLISEILYSEGQNKKSWKDLLLQFRKDPGLMKLALDKKDRYYCYFDLGDQRPRFSSSGKKRSNFSQETKTRPKSFKVAKGKDFNIDWSKSEIDNLVIKELYQFQAADDLYTNKEIEQLLNLRDCWNLDEVYSRTINTLEKLKTELLLPKSYMLPVSKTQESVERVLEICSKLFKVRALIVKILKIIHSREDLMLQLIDGEAEKIDELYIMIHKMNQEIIQIIAFLKHCKFPISGFVYLGKDYQEKIKIDNGKLLSLYPELENCELLGS